MKHGRSVNDCSSKIMAKSILFEIYDFSVLERFKIRPAVKNFGTVKYASMNKYFFLKLSDFEMANIYFTVYDLV